MVIEMEYDFYEMYLDEMGRIPALKPEEARLSLSLEPGGEEALRYLRGEALSLDGDQYPWLKGEKGWILVCIGTFSAGWGKLSGNVLKNHYPKGLRIR